MPFSFKPTEEPQAGAPTGMPSPQVTLGGATPPLSLRIDESKSSLLHTLLLGIFDIAVIATIVLFGYKYYLSAQIDSKKAQLASYESQLGALPFDDMRKVSNRLKLITQLIQTHPSVNVAFRLLEDSVENSVTYTRFDLHHTDATKGYELGLSALAANYHAVIQQMDTLASKPYSTYISKPVISNLHPDQTGLIGFTVTMPVLITGVLPETLILTTATSTQTVATSTVTMATTTKATTTATSTKSTTATSTSASTAPKTGTSTQPKK